MGKQHTRSVSDITCGHVNAMQCNAQNTVQSGAYHSRAGVQSIHHGLDFLARDARGAIRHDTLQLAQVVTDDGGRRRYEAV